MSGRIAREDLGGGILDMEFVNFSQILIVLEEILQGRITTEAILKNQVLLFRP